MKPQELQDIVIRHLENAGWHVARGYPAVLAQLPLAAVMWPQVEEGIVTSEPFGVAQATVTVVVVGAVGDSGAAAQKGAEELYRAWAVLRTLRPAGPFEMIRIRAAPTGMEVLNIAGNLCSGGIIELTFRAALHAP
ncbi:MAG: hypothetical protein RML46_06660 [Anaerolineae bacterium]|nr:hypothetical protein [Anaerolineae bacterium]